MSFSRESGNVGEITVLKSMPQADEALQLLKRIHHSVKPVMKKHGWYLPTLAEFYPSQQTLLGININGGHKICLRLRSPSNKASFIDLQSLIGVMLHELTHNIRGPHDDIFYKNLDQLTTEFQTLTKVGYLAFEGRGERVGDGRNLNRIQLRQARLKKAEEKERVQRLMGTQVLGGASKPAGPMREVLANAAARRLQDSQRCGFHPEEGQAISQEILDEIQLAENDSTTFVVDLTQESSDEDELTVVSISKRNKAEKQSVPSSKNGLKSPNIAQQSIEMEWSCPQCTLINDRTNLRCDVCNFTRTLDSGWICDFCAAITDHKYWSCTGCGNIKRNSAVP